MIHEPIIDMLLNKLQLLYLCIVKLAVSAVSDYTQI